MSGKGQKLNNNNQRRRVRRRKRKRRDELPEAHRPVKLGELKESELLHLQRTYGNAYVQRLLAEREEKGEGAKPATDKEFPDGLRQKMENAFETDFSGVRVQEDGQVEQDGARAVTSGEDIRFAPGQYNPNTESGQALLGHELAHVVQQRQGGASPAVVEATLIQRPALEGEADRAGTAAAQGQAVQVSGASAGSQSKQYEGKVERDPEIKPGEFKLGKQLKELSQAQFATFRDDYLSQALESGESDAQLKVNLQRAEAYLLQIIDVIVEAWDKWRQEAHFFGLNVNGKSVIGGQGCLFAPELIELMKDQGLPAKGNMETNYSEAISLGLSENWKLWQDNVTVPGLHLFPEFASYNGSDAPPTPSVPMPFEKFESKEKQYLTADKLMEKFEKYYEGENPTAQGVFSTVAESVSQIFFIWLKTHMVQRIMGSGHVSGYSQQNTSGPVVGTAEQAPPAMALE